MWALIPDVSHRLNCFSYISEYMHIEKLSMEDVPQHLVQHVSKKQLEEYNNSLPDRESIAEFNNNLDSYEYIQTNGFPFSITVKNSGTMKANDVRITLDFPAQIMIMDKENFDN